MLLGTQFALGGQLATRSHSTGDCEVVSSLHHTINSKNMFIHAREMGKDFKMCTNPYLFENILNYRNYITNYFVEANTLKYLDIQCYELHVLYLYWPLTSNVVFTFLPALFITTSTVM